MNDDANAETPLIRVRALQKWYGNVHALRGIDMHIGHKEVVGLVGDNGAGKSTLIKVISGAHGHDKGQMFFENNEVRFRSTRDAMRLGIETIYQYSALLPQMSIARNLFIGREPTRFKVGPIGILDKARMRRDAMEAIRDVGLELRSPDTKVDQLSGGERQGVVIARAMYFKTKVMILDEPTNHLSVRETNRVLDFVASLREQNIASIFISHNIHHVISVADRVLVMVRGEKVADLERADTSVGDVERRLMA